MTDQNNGLPAPEPLLDNTDLYFSLVGLPSQNVGLYAQAGDFTALRRNSRGQG